MIPDSIFFRVDANVNIGMGHARRCLIIAKEIKKNSEITDVFFISKSLPESFQNELKQNDIRIIYYSAPNIGELAFITKAITIKNKPALIIDSYQKDFYNENFQKEILTKVSKLVYIVLDNKCHYYAHILHNQNPLALTMQYETESYTKKLFGLKYLIIDEEFRRISKTSTPQNIKKQNNIALITFGGSDPYNLTIKTIKALDRIKSKFKKVIVVVGEMYPFGEDLKKTINSSSLNIELYKNTHEIQKLMLLCNVAFIPGGITTWELGALGIPVIILPFGEKVRAVARLLDSLNFAQYVEDPLNLTDTVLSEKIEELMKNSMYEHAKALKAEIDVDGIQYFVSSLFD